MVDNQLNMSSPQETMVKHANATLWYIKDECCVKVRG